MMEKVNPHVTAIQLARLASREFPEDEQRKVIRHLITGCAICIGTARTAIWSDNVDLDYTGLIRRLDLSLVVAQGEIDTEKKHAEMVWSRIRELAPDRRLFIIKNNPECQTWGILNAAIEAMKTRISNDPLEALDLAGIAVIISECLDVQHYGEERVADFQASAYTSLGNTKRILGDFQGAEAALRKARELLRNGTGDPYERANLISIYCSLKADLGYLEDATDILNQALRHARRIRDNHLTARLTLQQSSYIGYVDPILGSELAKKGAALIDPGESLFLELAGKYLTAYWTNELGDPRLASAMIESARYMFDNFKDTFWTGRLLHLKGNIARTEGNLRHAEFFFRELVDLYSASNFEFDLALASLDLSEVLAKVGQVEDATTILEQLYPALEAWHLHGDILRTWLIVREGVKVRSIQSETFREAAMMLRRKWHRKETSQKGV